jgi:PAS domain S-box-containing protein
MKYTFPDLVDVAKVQRLTDLFYTATGIPASVIGLDGTIITRSGWQAVCTDFHRTNARTARRCMESDTIIASKVAVGQRYTVYRCKNGLIDAATPITIDGDHVANFFTGQFLFEPPDTEYFREQAQRFGFDETAYMEAVAGIPVVEEVRLRPFLEYLSEFAVMLGEMGLKQLKEIEAAAISHQYEVLARHTRDIVLFLRADNGRILEANIAATKAYGYTREELLSLTIHDLRADETRGETTAQMAEAVESGLLFETVHRCKDGTTFPVEVSSRGETIDGEQMLISVVRDITERKRTENALRESEQRWATTLASVGDAVIATDQLGRITFMNSAWRKT